MPIIVSRLRVGQDLVTIDNGVKCGLELRAALVSRGCVVPLRWVGTNLGYQQRRKRNCEQDSLHIKHSSIIAGYSLTRRENSLA